MIPYHKKKLKQLAKSFNFSGTGGFFIFGVHLWKNKFSDRKVGTPSTFRMHSLSEGSRIQPTDISTPFEITTPTS